MLFRLPSLIMTFLCLIVKVQLVAFDRFLKKLILGERGACPG